MSDNALNLVLALLPETVLLAGGLLLVVLLPREKGERATGPGAHVPALIALVAVIGAIYAMLVGPRLTPDETLSLQRFAGISLDQTAQAGRWAALILGILLIGANYSLPERRPGRFLGDRGTPEFFMLLLVSLSGLMLTAQADDLIVLVLALELTTLPTFVAIALSRPQHGATESAGKYFFLGALSVALLAMGLVYIFGVTGETNLQLVRARLVDDLPAAPGYPLLIGMGLALAGLAFKIAAVPYHVYIADVYEGSAAPVAGWLGFVPKAAGFLALARLLTAVGGPAGVNFETGALALTGWVGHPLWGWMIWGLAAATMTVGNVLALWQKSVKRLLAYSSVAHSGYLLVALLLVPDQTGRHVATALLFYLVVYGIANLGAFLVLSAARVPDADGGTREAESFADLHGLARRSLPLAAAMGIFAFALMGLPPTAGFLGKAYVFLGALEIGLTWLVAIALVNAAIGAAYYLRIVAACWIGGGEEAERAGERAGRSPGPAQPAADHAPPQPEPDQPAPAGNRPPPGLVIAMLAFLTLLLGIAPGRLEQWLTRDLVLQFGRDRPAAQHRPDPDASPPAQPAPDPHLPPGL